MQAAPELLSRLPGLTQRWRAGEFEPPELAALYFLHWQISLHGQNFASRKNKGDPRPIASEWLTVMEKAIGEDLRKRLRNWLECYQFRGVVSNVPVALLQWLRGLWPLILREDIPGPQEVLHMQARGYRAVTIFTTYPRLCMPVLNKPNAFAFFLHDLEHAYKFFHSPTLHNGQCEFFTLLEDAIDRGVFAPCFKDAEFVVKFHYLMSDMNTHPEHSRQYLRAILVEHQLRSERKAPKDALSSTAERVIKEVMRAAGVHVPLVICARRAERLPALAD